MFRPSACMSEITFTPSKWLSMCAHHEGINNHSHEFNHLWLAKIINSCSLQMELDIVSIDIIDRCSLSNEACLYECLPNNANVLVQAFVQANKIVL